MTVLNVKIQSPLADEIEKLVKKGIYPDADEAVADLLFQSHVFAEPETPEYTAWLKAEAQKGLDDIEAGRIVDFDPKAILEEARRRNARK